jgi:calcineurin-like phosphoesterase
LNILFVGDIFGSAGRKIVREHIGHVRKANDVDLTIINVENAAGGFGVTPQIAEDLFDLGADVLTTGNHVWDKRELIDYMNSAARTARPVRAAFCARQLPARLPGYGVFEGTLRRPECPTQSSTWGPRLHGHQRSLPRHQ